jgi:RND family efflux transporter MFP subunit
MTKILLALVGLSSLLLNSCSNLPSKENETKPATIQNPQKESELTTVTLSEEAEKKLGIEISTVKTENIPKSLSQHGEIVAIPGQSITITAPFTGRILNPINETKIQSGSFIDKGKTTFQLVMLPSDLTGFGSEQDIVVKRKQLELVEEKVKRLETLYQFQSTSKKLVEEAQTELVNAKAALKAAEARLRYLNGELEQEDISFLSSMNIKAPISGIIQKIFVSANQIVTTGEALFELSSLTKVWVRVPVYAGDLALIDSSSSASVISIGDGLQGKSRIAKHVPGPVSTNPQAVSTDLYYELDNQDSKFKLGQKVNVIMSLVGNNDTKLTIPASAIVYDVHGGTWVYEYIGEHLYSRKRIAVDRVENQIAIISKGINLGMQIVVAGAAELFGTEFGTGK